MLSPTHVQIQPQSVAEGRCVGRRTLVVDLPAERVLVDASLIDRIIDTVFNDLDYTTVEVRVRHQHMGIMP